MQAFNSLGLSVDIIGLWCEVLLAYENNFWKNYQLNLARHTGSQNRWVSKASFPNNTLSSPYLYNE